MQRFVMVAVVMLLAMTVQTSRGQALPGVWVEGESTGDSRGWARQGVADAAGGGCLRYINLDGFGFRPQAIDAIERPRVYVRYRREQPGPAKIRVVLRAEDVPAGTRPADLQAEVLLPAVSQDPPRWSWAAANFPAIPAGKYRIFVNPLTANPALDIDLFGFADRTGRERWMPPGEVKDGQLTGAGSTMPAAMVTSFEVRSPVRLVIGDEQPDGTLSPIAFDAVVTNNLNERVTLQTAYRFAGEAGEVARVEGPRIELAPEETRPVEFTVRPPGFGLFRVTLDVNDGTGVASNQLSLGVLRKPAEGLRPDSMFGLNIAYTDQDLAAAKMIGLKWRRGTPYSFDPLHVSPEPGKWMDDKDADPVRAAVRKWKDAGVLTLGLVNYNTTWNTAPDRKGKPVARWQNRPIDLKVQAEIEYRMFKALRGEVTFWEIWNEPWVGGWTWQTGTAQDYREMSRLIWEKVKPDMPEIMLIGGGSTSYQRDILFAPGNPDIGYADGCSTHPYNSPDRTMPSSAAVEAVLLKKYSKSKGVAGIWATEVGAPTYTFLDQPPAKRPYTSAKCVAPLYLLNRIGAGDMPIRVFYFCANWGDGSAFSLWEGADAGPGLVAFSAMTHFLEDGKFVEDVFASSTAMWGPMFTRPDGSTVIAFWAEDGFAGSIGVPTDVFEVYDYLGGRVSPKGGQAGLQTLQFERWQTYYLVSRKPEAEVRQGVARIAFTGMDALRINPRSFADSLDKLPPLRLKLENLRPTTVDATVSLTTSPEIELAEPKLEVKGLKSGEVRFIEFPVRKATPNATNRYRVEYSSVVDGLTQKGVQVVQAAFATFGTPVVDGKLDEWKDVTPVTMLSRGGKDFLEAALDPSKAAAILGQKTPGDTVAYRAWTRWDESNFYFAAEVPDAELSSKPPAAKYPDAFAFEGDSVVLAFDCLEPNPDDWFANHPLREKCLGSEVDYEFSLIRANDGDGPPIAELHRLKAPGTSYQTLYETNVPTDPPLGVMNTAPARSPAGQVAITYDATAKTLRYEAAIPWTAIKELGDQLKALKPGQRHLGKFAFGITDAPARGRTFWTQEAGDLQSGAYGFSPTWSGGSTRAGGRILTDWGFVR